jgi:2-polyprenyl-3-methyl-5-hydroxy-6-metoxy-1,4-benzoquinol methylase
MPERYTRLQVPGLPGVFFREMDLPLAGRELSILAASAVDVLTAPRRGRAAAPDAIPYWCVAWPAGLGLARCLARQDLSGRTVLEVGCGVGISGLGAALAGAAVLVTDNEPASLRLAMMNARRNQVPLRASGADWRAWPVSGRFDRVIGSDVTYEVAAFDALLDVLARTLSPGGEVLLSDPGRLMTGAFLQRAAAAGWAWEMEQLPPEGPQAVFLYRLHRRSERALSTGD